jgi:hypothetical protein
MVTLHPGRSLIHHIGADGTGSNASYTNSMDAVLSDRPINVVKQEPVESTHSRKVLAANFRRMKYLRPWNFAVGLLKTLARRSARGV